MIKRLFTLGCIGAFGILLFLFALSSVVSGADYTYTNPQTIGLTSNTAEDFLIADGSGGSAGDISSCLFQDYGLYSCASSRINFGTNITGAIEVPTTNDVIFANQDGEIGLVNQLNTVPYNAFGIIPSWYGGGVATNPMYKLYTGTTYTYPKKFAVDSSLNVYFVDGVIVKKLVYPKYLPQTFYTLVDTVDYDAAYTGGVGTSGINILGIQVDSSDNVHVLIGTWADSGGPSGTRFGYLSRTVINSAGTRVVTDLKLKCDGSTPGVGCQEGNYATAGFYYGGLIVDLVNPNQNYTYAYTGYINAGDHIIHNSSTGSVDVGGGDLTPTPLNDLAYKDFTLYVADYNSNLIFTLATNYEGYGVAVGAPANPDGITGTFSWLNGLGASITTLNPGTALTYRWTISNESLPQYTFYSGWGYGTATMPDQLQDLTDLTGLGKPAVFSTSSNTLAGISIYGYLLAKNNTDSTWSILHSPVKLTINPALAGYDSITLDKTFYNLTGDTVTATFTYKDGLPYIYQWQICSRVDCSDGNIFTLDALIPGQKTASFYTTGKPEGNYYAVMMKHFPFLPNEIVDYQQFQLRPPVIGVSWDKTSYNLLPLGVSTSCLDSTPGTSYFTTINGYAGLQKGFFSCSVVPSVANANNSVMRGSLYAKYNGTFFLNNSLGSIWNGTLSNGSGTLIYVLTNGSATEDWTLTGVNDSTGESFSAVATVKQANIFGYALNIDKTVAYKTDTLMITYSRPIYVLSGNVILQDADGNILTTCAWNLRSCQYYIDPGKEYVYGTWTAMWTDALGTPLNSLIYSGVIDTVLVKEGLPPKSGINGSVPIGGDRVSGTLDTCDFFDNWVEMMFGKINNITRFAFALIIISIVLIFTGVGMKSIGAGVLCAFFPYVFFVFLSLASPCGEYIPVWTAVFIALIIGIKLKWFN